MQKLDFRLLQWKLFALLQWEKTQRWLTAHANHTSQAPKVSSPTTLLITQSDHGTHRCASPSTPLWIMPMIWQIFLGISPNTQQLSHSSVMSRMSLCIYVCIQLCVHLCMPFSVCVLVCDWMCELRTYKWESYCKCIRGWRAYLCQSHMWLIEQIHSAWRLKPKHLSQQHIKSPQAGHTVSRRPSQKCTESSVLCVSHLLSLLHECLLASSPLPAHSLLPLPFFFSSSGSDIY